MDKPVTFCKRFYSKFFGTLCITTLEPPKLHTTEDKGNYINRKSMVPLVSKLPGGGST